MIITLSLVIVFAIGIFIYKKSYDYDIFGMILCVISAIYLVLHFILWSLASFDFEIFEEKRKAFSETLVEARNSGRELEAAAILKEVSEWNIDLASRKYCNSTFLLKDYYDDRIDDLLPIK